MVEVGTLGYTAMQEKYTMVVMRCYPYTYLYQYMIQGMTDMIERDREKDKEQWMYTRGYTDG